MRSCFFVFLYIGSGYIEESGMFNRKKIIPYNEISKAVIEYGDNVSYILIFTKTAKKPVLKVNTYYENAFLLKELLAKKKLLK